MNTLYWLIVGGIVLWLMLVFETLLGLRIVSLRGELHARVHRWLSFVLIVGGLVLGVCVIGSLLLGWF